MLSANKEKISPFLEGKIQFHIPFFQRSYVWTIENWQGFYDDIFELSTNNRQKLEHFIGTVIVKQKKLQT